MKIDDLVELGIVSPPSVWVPVALKSREFAHLRIEGLARANSHEISPGFCVAVTTLRTSVIEDKVKDPIALAFLLGEPMPAKVQAGARMYAHFISAENLFEAATILDERIEKLVEELRRFELRVEHLDDGPEGEKSGRAAWVSIPKKARSKT